MSLQDHVRDNLELCDTLQLQLRFELFSTERCHRKVVVLPICAAEVDLLVFMTTALNRSAHSLNYDAVLRARFHFRQYILSRKLDASLREAGEIR